MSKMSNYSVTMWDFEGSDNEVGEKEYEERMDFLEQMIDADAEAYRMMLKEEEDLAAMAAQRAVINYVEKRWLGSSQFYDASRAPAYDWISSGSTFQGVTYNN